MNNNTNNTNGITAETNLESLIRKLKDEDSRQAKMLHRIYIIYIAIIVLFSGMYILNPDPDLGFYQRLTGAIYILAFTMMAFVIRKYYSLLRKVDYTQSVYQVLKKPQNGIVSGKQKEWYLQPYLFSLLILPFPWFLTGDTFPTALPGLRKR